MSELWVEGDRKNVLLCCPQCRSNKHVSPAGVKRVPVNYRVECDVGGSNTAAVYVRPRTSAPPPSGQEVHPVACRCLMIRCARVKSLADTDLPSTEVWIRPRRIDLPANQVRARGRTNLSPSSS